jgi:hypothetical protein
MAGRPGRPTNATALARAFHGPKQTVLFRGTRGSVVENGGLSWGLMSSDGTPVSAVASSIAAAAAGTTDAAVQAQLTALLQRNKDLEKELETLRRAQVLSAADDVVMAVDPAADQPAADPPAADPPAADPPAADPPAADPPAADPPALAAAAEPAAPRAAPTRKGVPNGKRKKRKRPTKKNADGLSKKHRVYDKATIDRCLEILQQCMSKRLEATGGQSSRGAESDAIAIIQQTTGLEKITFAHLGRWAKKAREPVAPKKLGGARPHHTCILSLTLESQDVRST